MVILRNAIFTMVLIHLSAFGWCGEYVNPKASAARQKENDWVMIERYTDVELTPNVRSLVVKVQFLKQCQSTGLPEMLDRANTKRDSVMWEKYAAAGMIVFYIAKLNEDGKAEQAQEAMDNVYKKTPEVAKIIENYYLFPKYDCDYRTKINTTYFTKFGTEMKTDSEYPVASGGDGMKRKLTVFPGDTVTVKFIIPEEAEKWDVWVSK